MSDPVAPPDTVNVVSSDGASTRVATQDQLPALIAAGYHVESGVEQANRASAEFRSQEYGGLGNQVKAGLLGGARGLSLGLSDVAARALGQEHSVRELQEENPISSTIGEVGGAVLPAFLTGGESIAGSLARATPIGRAAELGAGISRLGEGGGALARIGAKAAGGAVEGGLIGAGQGVSELALDDHPLTWEHAVSAISSNALLGGALGGGIGALSGGVEAGLSRARSKLDAMITERAAAEKAAAGGAIPEDLTGVDSKGLKAARESELERIETTERAPARQQIKDDLAEFRKDVKDQKLWLATKDAEQSEVRVIGKQMLKSDRALDNLLDNPIKLAENPKPALGALQQQEHALNQLTKKSDELRIKFAADGSGERVAALDAVPGALERNKALQGRIKALAAEPTSARLTAIDDAKEALSSGSKKSGTDLLKEGAAFAAGSHVVGGLVPGLGMLTGAYGAVKAISGVVKLIKNATSEQMQSVGKVIDAFATGAGKAPRVAVPLASKTLAAVRFGPEQSAAGKGASGDLAKDFRARQAEINKLTAYDATGTPKMRPDARAKIADALSPIRHVAPVAADRMETVAARKIETYAAMQPRRPDIATPTGGPDKWQPSDSQMRGWARVISVGENPGAFEKRCVSGLITPEEVAAYKAIYPERYQHFVSSVMAKLPTLQQSLPYSRRVTLSMLTGAPVEPAMHPAVLAVLQGSFKAEPGSAGGTMAPRPSPQFGSVKKSVASPTPGQQRAQGGLSR